MERYEMRKKNLDILPKASEMDLELNPQSVGFTEIIGSIYASIELFDPDIDLEMNLNLGTG